MILVLVCPNLRVIMRLQVMLMTHLIVNNLFPDPVTPMMTLVGLWGMNGLSNALRRVAIGHL